MDRRKEKGATMEPIVIRPNRRLITKFALIWLLIFVLVAAFCC